MNPIGQSPGQPISTMRPTILPVVPKLKPPDESVPSLCPTRPDPGMPFAPAIEDQSPGLGVHSARARVQLAARLDWTLPA